MDKEIKLTAEQITVLNKIIKAVKNGELTSDELISGLSAPVNNNNNNHQNWIQRAAGTIGATGIGLTVLTMTIFAAKVLPEMSLSEIDDIKKESTLERLLEIRNAAIAKNK